MSYYYFLLSRLTNTQYKKNLKNYPFENDEMLGQQYLKEININQLKESQY